jgi:hypothetical protein
MRRNARTGVPMCRQQRGLDPQRAAGGHLVGEAYAFARLGRQYNALYATRDFQEGRAAEAQNRPPV